MPVDPQVARFLEQAAKANIPPLETVSVAEARDQMDLASSVLGPKAKLPAIDDHRTDGEPSIPVRVYYPQSDAGAAPAIVYFHGGGFVIGSVETHDAYCRALAEASQCVVASVDYRLAPEHKHPAAVEDAYAATCWIAENAPRLRIDARRLAVAGDSAGGNLAAVVALMARDRGGPALVHQVLIYPVTDAVCDRASYHEFAEGYMLTRAAMRWFWNHYVQDESFNSHPHVSPLHAESLAGLPSALIITAEYDPLRDEGEAYADRLMASGVDTTLSRYGGMIHGFTRRLRLFDKAGAALDEVAQSLRERLGVD
ncbi:MAG: alpha/beta hydrolase [Pirellulaceae bacterium]